MTGAAAVVCGVAATTESRWAPSGRATEASRGAETRWRSAGWPCVGLGLFADGWIGDCTFCGSGVLAAEALRTTEMAMVGAAAADLGMAWAWESSARSPT